MLTEFTRQLLAAAFATGIGTIGVQDADATDGGDDFTAGRRRQTRIQPPVEPLSPDEDTFCVVDVETTGLSPERDAIIEIAAIRKVVRTGLAQEEEFTELVRPPGNIPKAVREKTGITNELVMDADTIDQVLPRVAAFVGDARIVAHNAHFDRRFLERNARLVGLTFAENAWCAR